ncbi:methylated-DNA--[protein]-cysteine S-methyltransferase [Floccifex porci]|uniref:Methylated-DNA--protein-cysteine methyltransferase n=1 Tax=Floccifex porci TaxID=2606629 RepID=A0A7X2T3Q3_9FIRM|nr:methylated-DNA--[protein]-cysteine S-methyltransferase [Floccifex porci]MSS01685.1 methylated-DNA--[protein]-cysteine S-methyltransferase [Floccifex porci]
MSYDSFNSPYGDFILEEKNGKIVKIYPGSLENKETSFICTLCKHQLIEYFEGKRKEFEIPFDVSGTSFQIKVWNEVLKIPYGQTKSYQEIASLIGNPKASRAIGMAVHKNPIPFIIPCHRVIGKKGKLTGYAYGLSFKRELLEMEKKHD